MKVKQRRVQCSVQWRRSLKANNVARCGPFKGFWMGMAPFSLSHIGEKDEGKEAKENHFSSQPAKQPRRRYLTNPEAVGVVKSHSFIENRTQTHSYLSILLTHTSTVCVTTDLIHDIQRAHTHYKRFSLITLYLLLQTHTDV
ncbi:hypothetical protein EYF80_038517 [Liparis tanakae]|uniref:Uncharacterized protein n=1 Tax=Liparis tanakae TaxID=230148 RepID=A0A4Z2GD63_9TELE|nr:hypothetical protein EYF80_038517 [Liparis tanakae]